jgi:putative endonuclease
VYVVYAIYNRLVDKVYIGQTSDIDKRIKEHNLHTFAGFTSRFEGKWELIFKESVATRSEALKREKQLKSYRGREFIKTHIRE